MAVGDPRDPVAARGATRGDGGVGAGGFHLASALIAAGTRFVATAHEAGAATMADAYARVSGRGGVLTGHQGPGVTNALTGIAEALGFSGLLAISAVAALIAILISETTSNTASATIVVPIVIPIAQAAGLDPMIPALAAVIGASFGFMMPVSTPQNAVVYGSGLIPITKMVRSGIAFDIAGLVLTVLLVPTMVRVVGLA